MVCINSKREFPSFGFISLAHLTWTFMWAISITQYSKLSGSPKPDACKIVQGRIKWVVPQARWLVKKKSYSFKSWFHKILCVDIKLIILRFQLLPRQCKKWVGKQVLLRFSMFEIDLGVSVFCYLIGWYFYHHVGFRKGREAGLTLEDEVVALWRLTSISRWSKAKFK